MSIQEIIGLICAVVGLASLIGLLFYICLTTTKTEKVKRDLEIEKLKLEIKHLKKDLLDDVKRN